MNKTDTVSIGGIHYDSRTGLPMAGHSPAPTKPQKMRDIQSVHAKGVHAAQQRSATLNRRFVTKAKKPAHVIASKTTRNMDIRPAVKRSPHISKFARDPQAFATKRVVTDIAPTAHPAAKKAHTVQAVKATVVQPKQAPSAKDIKHAELGKALANAKAVSGPAKKPRRRAFSVAAASLGVLLVAGYFTYVNMPNLSVRIAAAQAGIEASFPDYRPVGYSLDGPVAYTNGEVSMKFKSNSGPVAFLLNQSNSGWDSSALLEKYVNPHSHGKYATYNDGGLTIYTYGTAAAWVNGGILYTIEGTANLSNEQVRRIATSM